MNPLLADHRRARRLSGFGLALAAALALAPAAPAADGVYQAADAADQITYYTDLNTVRIPFGEVDRRYVEVALYVSRNSARPTKRQPRPTPATANFASRRPATACTGSRCRPAIWRALSPPDMSLAQPRIKMCVDTHPPTISNFRWLQPQNGQVGVEWEVIDLNLDPTSLRGLPPRQRRLDAAAG